MTPKNSSKNSDIAIEVSLRDGNGDVIEWDGFVDYKCYYGVTETDNGQFELIDGVTEGSEKIKTPNHLPEKMGVEEGQGWSVVVAPRNAQELGGTDCIVINP